MAPLINSTTVNGRNWIPVCSAEVSRMSCTHRTANSTTTPTAKLKQKVAKLRPSKVRLRNSDRSSIGCSLRRSAATNRTTRTADPIKHESVTGELQPRLSPRVMPKISANIDAVIITRPGQSIGLPWLALNSRTRVNVIISATRPRGTFSRNTQRQFSSVSTPPSSGPAAIARPVVAPNTANALPRSRPWKSCAIRAGATANMTAAPTPCTPRATSSMIELGAAPQHSDAIVNTQSPTVQTRRRPRRSASEPAVSSSEAREIEYASITHWMQLKLMFRSRWIDGRATLTTVKSSSSMNVAMETVASIHQRRPVFSGAALSGSTSTVTDMKPSALFLSPPEWGLGATARSPRSS